MGEGDERGFRKYTTCIHLHSQQEIKISRLKTINSERWDDIKRQNLLPLMAEKILLVFYKEIKHKWGRDEYTEF